MSKLILNDEFNLWYDKKDIYCDSLQIAEDFKKDHKNVLRDIKEMKCSEGFRQLNFEPSYYKNDQNKRQPKYNMTKNGMMILVMGYKTEKAMQIKEEYIKRFDLMLEWTKERFISMFDHRNLTDAVKDYKNGDAKFYHYSNEIDLIYKLVLNCTCKQFKTRFDIEDNGTIKEYLSQKQLIAFNDLQNYDCVLLDLKLNYEDRKLKLEERRNKLIIKLGGNQAYLNPPFENKEGLNDE